MKRAILAIARFLGLLLRLIPERLRNGVAMGLFLIESRSGDPDYALRRLFALSDRLDLAINERATCYGNGIHPKHGLTRYHDFFVDRIGKDARVLDIGCGIGAVSRSIATRIPSSIVVGVELDHGRLNQARSGEVPANLSFVEADARVNLPAGPWNVVILSNILEHIQDRIGFLTDILRQTTPEKVLIRVPLFERDWKLPMRQELGIGYFSDAEHFIEHRLDELRDEVRAAGLKPVEIITLWGEIWTECQPIVGM